MIHPSSGNKINFIINRQDARAANLHDVKPSSCYPTATDTSPVPKMSSWARWCITGKAVRRSTCEICTGILRVCGETVDREYVAQFAQRTRTDGDLGCGP